MEAGDITYYCCGECKGLFDVLDILVAHKLLKCDGSLVNSDCEYFACKRSDHEKHVKANTNANTNDETKLKRNKRKVTIENESPPRKKTHLVKRLREEKEKVKIPLEITSEGLYTAERRSSGRIRNAPAKYKDFTHSIKQEPEDVEEKVIEHKRKGRPRKNVVSYEEAQGIDKDVAPPDKEDKIEIDLGTCMPNKEEPDFSHVEVVPDMPIEQAEVEYCVEKENLEDESSGVLQSPNLRSTRKSRRDEEDEEFSIKEELIDDFEPKKSTVISKEQKERLVEKYKQYLKVKGKIGTDSDQETRKGNPVDGVAETGTEDGAQKVEVAETLSHDEGTKTTNEHDEDNAKKKIKRKRKKLKVDSDVEHYFCPVCKYSTRYVGFFDYHMTRAHDNGKLWTCDYCEYTHSSKAVMRLHLNAHIKPFMCEFCSHKFSTGIDLRKHRYTHTGETPYKCTKCDWAGRQKKALQEHMRKHTGDKLKCQAEGCQFETFYKWALEQHRRSKHEKFKRWQCPECPYATSDSGSWIKHKKHHMGVKDFKCGQCSYKGVTKNDVIKHMRIHTREKLYYCDRCSYSSCHSSAFKLHMMSHLGLKTWQCQLCSFSGTTKAKVLRHLEHTHQNNDRNNVANLRLKLQLNFDDFKIPPPGSAQPNIMYQVIETDEVIEDSETLVMKAGDLSNMSLVEVDAKNFEGLAGLAAASEAAAASAQTENAVTQIIVQTVGPDGSTPEEQHIELANLPPGVVTQTDGSNITFLQEDWPAAIKLCSSDPSGESVIETLVIEQPSSSTNV